MNLTKFKIGDEVFDQSSEFFGDIGIIVNLKKDMYTILWKTGSFKGLEATHTFSTANKELRLSDSSININNIKKWMKINNKKLAINSKIW